MFKEKLKCDKPRIAFPGPPKNVKRNHRDRSLEYKSL